ncbi:MAG: response regulator transcription factor [Chitinophagaceae bacterium]|nr:response regulator transcription factor [Chitinophagaceae bacterium]MCW5926938.1 response regulator transcription factor [Chitinophagaceae bacterium]
MKFQSIIVEDLQVSADFLRRFCEKSGVVEVHAHFLNAEDALNYLKDNVVDLIFLDVEMPGASGFELLDQLMYTPQVILTTSKVEYAYDAFQYNVTDYLKKPFTYQRFLESIQKVGKKSEQQNGNSEQDHMFIKSDGKLIRLHNDDILFIESMGDYVKFITSAKKYITHNTIKNLETKVNPQVFMKVHRSYIVNFTKINDIQENTLFINGNMIPISKTHKSGVMQKINIL